MSRLLIISTSGSHERALALWCVPLLLEKKIDVHVVHEPQKISHKSIESFADEYSLLVTTTPWWDNTIDWMTAFKKRNNPWVYHPEGWDNVHPLDHPSKKNHIKSLSWPFQPDVLCAHGAAMKRAAIRIRKLDEKNILITGGPRFDLYQKIRCGKIIPENPFFPLTRKPVVLVCSAPQWNHRFIIETLRGSFPDVFLVVRRHQCDPLHFYQDHCDLVFSPEGCRTEIESGDHHYHPDAEQLLSYASQLFHADVVVNIAGTPSLEAMMLHVPVVNIGYLPDQATEKEKLHLYLHHGTTKSHYADVRAGHSNYLARTPEELVKMLGRAIESGEKNPEVREEVVNDIMGPQDGGASKRIADIVEQLVRTS